MYRILKNYWPIIFLLFVSLFLCFQNYTPGTWLSGWDTLHPEFNFGEYFSRIFFGAWQQHQGLGSLATQAHASEIPRMFIYFPMSLFLPENTLRYAYFFITLILGPIGLYLLLKLSFFKEDTFQNKVVSFCGGLFYLLNLAILQHYYVPFEMFATHFASLPFIFLFALKFIEENSKKYLIFYCLTIFMSASIAHTATLWFVFFALFVLFILSFALLNRNKKILKNTLILLFLTLFINFFWLLPNIYFIISEGQLINQAKITSLFSGEAFAQNVSFGTLPDLVIFKNFLFNWGQYVGNNSFGPLLPDWSDHLKQPFVLLIGNLYFLIALIGIIYSLFKKNLKSFAFLSIFLTCIFFWLNVNPPFGFIFSYLQNHLPFFKEALRFPFTKFSIFLVFVVSIYFAWGLSFFIEISKKIKLGKIFPPLLLLIVSASLIYYMLPAFQGKFFDPNMKVKIPNEYFAMFNWFKNQPQGRVAEFPIHSFWGWQYYSWNYQGAGFLWFGIKQPLLNREFDRWNLNNEQYYREMSQAVYAQNQDLFKQVIKKYDINYILVDKNVIAPGPGINPKILFFDEINKLLENDKEFNSVNKFGKNLFVYSKTKNTTSNNWVYLLNKPTSVSPIDKASYEDFAYSKYGDYITIKDNNDVFFPFRNALDNQNHLLSAINIKNNGLNLNFNSVSGNFNFQNFQNLEQLLPADLYIEKKSNILNIKLYPDLPIKNLTALPIPISTSVTLPKETDVILSINQTENYVLSKISDNTPLSVDKVLLNTQKTNDIAIYPFNEDVKILPDFSNVKYTLETCGKSDKNPIFGISNINKNSFSIFGKNAEICMVIPIINIFPNLNQQFHNNIKELLMSLSVNYQGDNNSNICIAKLNKSGCLYYLSQNLKPNAVNSQNTLQYFGIKKDEINNLVIRIYLDTTKNTNLKKVSYSGFAIGFTKPISSLSILPNTLTDSLANVKTDKLNNYQLSIPFSGIQDLSKDITKLPRTAGDCPAPNPKGANPSNKQIVKDETNQYIRYSSEGSSFCDHFSYTNLPHNQAYLISIVSRNIKGLPIRLCITNNYSSRCDIYTQLSSSADFSQDLFLLPDMGQGNGYDININNFSIERAPSVNDLKSINIIPFPYQWLSHAEVENNGFINQLPPQRIEPNMVSHPNQSLYLIELSENELNKGSNVLVLSQSFEKGWTAYGVKNFGILDQLFPFIFGKKISDHIEINNWSNGWMLNGADKKIVIVFLPQYLEYLGLAILILVLIFFLKKPFGKKH